MKDKLFYFWSACKKPVGFVRRIPLKDFQEKQTNSFDLSVILKKIFSENLYRSYIHFPLGNIQIKYYRS